MNELASGDFRQRDRYMNIISIGAVMLFFCRISIAVAIV